MSEQEKQEGQKTVVAFIAGLLIGGLLVWVFGGAPANDATDEIISDTGTEDVVDSTDADDAVTATDDAVVVKPSIEVGDGAIDVVDQPAGSAVALESATFPTEEGWVAVRSYPNGQLGSILGAARYSKEQGLVPETVPLLAPTSAGRTYAVVFFTEDGDRQFSLANDVQIDGVLSTFVAQ